MKENMREKNNKTLLLASVPFKREDIKIIHLTHKIGFEVYNQNFFFVVSAIKR
jgi:hypothetical protein